MFGRRLRCSFCGLSEERVEKLVAGPRVYICDRCVAIASDIMSRHEAPPTPPARPGLIDRVARRLARLMKVGTAQRRSAGVAPRRTASLRPLAGW